MKFRKSTVREGGLEEAEVAVDAVSDPVLLGRGGDELILSSAAPYARTTYYHATTTTTTTTTIHSINPTNLLIVII